MAESKTCSGCGETKPAVAFTRDTRARDGLQSRCKACTSAYFSAWSAQRRAALHPPTVAAKTCTACGVEKPAEVRAPPAAEVGLVVLPPKLGP